MTVVQLNENKENWKAIYYRVIRSNSIESKDWQKFWRKLNAKKNYKMIVEMQITLSNV